MRNTKLVSVTRVKPFCICIALMLVMLVLAPPAAHAQNVFVPANASGALGNPVDIVVPLVSAITVSGPGPITVTYVSGTVSDSGYVGGGPNGIQRDCSGVQVPLKEALGVSGGWCVHLNALIGVFVPKRTVEDRRGFQAIDGTKNLTGVGIQPYFVHFIGTGGTFNVKEAGTLFLGINDCCVSDNSGGFNVTVTGP
jgi:hypothetical protein